MKLTYIYNNLLLLVAFILFVENKLFSQGVAINNNTATANPSAMLDVSSTSKGLLIPRMTTTERNAISSPANGLMIYNLNTSSFQYYDANVLSWKEISNSAQLNIGIIPKWNPPTMLSVAMNDSTTSGGTRLISLYTQQLTQQSDSKGQFNGTQYLVDNSGVKSGVHFTQTSIIGGVGGVTWSAPNVYADFGLTGFSGSNIISNGTVSKYATGVFGYNSISGNSTTVDTAVGIAGRINLNGGASNVVSAIALEARPIRNLGFTGTLTNAYGAKISAPGVGTNQWTLAVDVGNSYILGNLGIGTTAPSKALDINGEVNISGKLNIATGNNKSVGTATFSNGTVIVSTTAVTANSKIYYGLANCNNCGTPYTSAINSGSSFTINSTNESDGSMVNWWIIN